MSGFDDGYRVSGNGYLVLDRLSKDSNKRGIVSFYRRDLKYKSARDPAVVIPNHCCIRSPNTFIPETRSRLRAVPHFHMKQFANGGPLSIV
jgi:hypothetical protein